MCISKEWVDEKGTHTLTSHGVPAVPPFSCVDTHKLEEVPIKGLTARKEKGLGHLPFVVGPRPKA